MSKAIIQSPNSHFSPEYEHQLRIYALLKERIPGFNRHTGPIHDEPDKLNSLTKAVSNT